MTSTPRASRTAAIATAMVCWAGTLVLLLAVPSLASVESGLAAIISPPGTGLWWVMAATLALQSLALLGIRTAPRAGLLVIAALALGLGLVSPGVAYTVSHLPVVVAVYLAAPRRPWGEMRLALSLTALAVAIGTLVNALRSGLSTMPGVLGEAFVQGAGLVGTTTLAALALASIRTARQSQRKELEALVREREALDREREALDRERAALTRAAASEERAAMARELHDIAAHHLSGIALLAAAAERQIATDPQAARESVRQVRSQTRAVLDDVRRVVGLLRGGQPPERSVENLATVPALVRARAEAGMAVRLEQHPAADGRDLGEGVGPLAQLVAYRMIQESVTNSAVHAPGATALVALDDTDPSALAVTVCDDGPASPIASAPATQGTGGHGLIGMHERAGLVGAQLEHGPTADGGWRVHLSIPRDLTGTRAARPAPASQEGAP